MSILNRPWIPILVFLTISSGTGFGVDPPVGLSGLSPEIAKVFTDTLIPNLGICEARDLDGDGSEEIVVFSGVPLSEDANESESMTISFQNLLMVFRKRSEVEGAFPYQLSVKKSVTSLKPNPIHVTLEDMGGDSNPEVVWLEEGPDAKGRYAKAILYSYQGSEDPPLVERARFENPSGWVRVHDLDRDGVSEVIAFSEIEGQTICPDLLYFKEDRWTSLRTEIQYLGFGDIAAFQRSQSLEPDGRVTRELLVHFKNYRTSGSALPSTPSTQEALGPIYE